MKLIVQNTQSLTLTIEILHIKNYKLNEADIWAEF